MTDISEKMAKLAPGDTFRAAAADEDILHWCRVMLADEMQVRTNLGLVTPWLPPMQRVVEEILRLRKKCGET